MDFKKKAEDIIFQNYPSLTWKKKATQAALDIEKALKETWNEAVKESALIAFSYGKDFVSEKIRELKVKP